MKNLIICDRKQNIFNNKNIHTPNEFDPKKTHPKNPIIASFL